VAERHAYCVWELTLACNLACGHCGSRAGQARNDELTTDQALDVVRQLAAAGVREVTLIGGEAFLRPDWLEIAAAIVEHGMLLEMATGGYGVSATTARRMKEVGFSLVSVSVDGLEAVHDRLRGRSGSFAQCLLTLERLRAAGITTAVNSQINRLSAPQLPRLYERVRETGVYGWQLGLTVPMGRASERPEWLMQPAELRELYALIGTIAERAAADGIRLQPGNNLGYYGPHERLMRDHPSGQRFWQGCQAGLETIGIEADGTLKGCPSLPTASYAAGNLRERSLAELLRRAPELSFNLHAYGDREGLWGHCAGCEYGPLCRGGCNWTAHVFFGRRGNNVYCHHRALQLATRGRRERVVPRTLPRAPGSPFDHGRFAILEEPANAPWPEDDPLRFTLERVQWPAGWRTPTVPAAAPGRGELQRSTAPAPEPNATQVEAPERFGARNPFGSSLDRVVTLRGVDAKLRRRPVQE
jgi:radical SAM protein with 4Fe4S-binding SPASM domain